MRITHLAAASAVAFCLFAGAASAGPSGGVVVAAATTGDVQTGSQTQAVTTVPAQTQGTVPTQTATETQNLSSPGSKVSLNPQPLPPKSKARIRYAPGTFVTLNPQPLPPKIRFTSGIAFGFRR